MSLFEITAKATRYIVSIIAYKPSVSFYMGTGQSSFLDLLDSIEHRIPYSDIPGMKTASVSSHTSEVVFGHISGVPVSIWRGRLHYYEGHSMDDITLPVRISGLLGISKAIFLNAAGGINIDYRAGDLVLAEDHIYLFRENPLRGPHDERWGPRFPDMSTVYNLDWIAKCLAVREELDVDVHTGVYVGLMGPSLETPAEYRYLRTIGADLVGMSTLPEVIVAHEMGMQKIVISVISNVVDTQGNSIHKTTIEEVVKVVDSAMLEVQKLIKNIILDL